MRQIAAAVVLALMLGASTAGTASVALGQSEGGIDSGAIGLTRAAWEAAHGPGAPIEIPANFRELFGYEDGSYYVQFEDSKPGGEAEAIVVYVEAAWGGEGVPLEEAMAAAASLLPADAGLAEPPYLAPPTPGGPRDLVVQHYVSPALDELVDDETTDFTGNILVIYYATTTDVTAPGQHVATFEQTVTRASVLTALPTGN